MKLLKVLILKGHRNYLEFIVFTFKCFGNLVKVVDFDSIKPNFYRSCKLQVSFEIDATLANLINDFVALYLQYFYFTSRRPKSDF